MASDPNVRFFVGIDYAKAETKALASVLGTKIHEATEKFFTDFKTSYPAVNSYFQSQAADAVDAVAFSLAGFAKATRQVAKSMSFAMGGLARPLTPASVRSAFAQRPSASSWRHMYGSLGSSFDTSYEDRVDCSWHRVWLATKNRKAQRKRGPMPADWRETALVVALEGGAFESVCAGSGVLPYLGMGSRKAKDAAQAVLFAQRCSDRAWEIVGQRLLSKSRAIFADWVRCAEAARLKEEKIPQLPKLRFYDGSGS